MKIKLLLFVLLVSRAAIAQNTIDLFALSGRYGTPQPYDAPLENSKATETGLAVNIKVPVKFTEKTMWFSNFSYNQYGVTNGLNLSPELANPINLNGFILQTGLIQRIDENRAFHLLFVPRFMTDFVAPTGKSWQFGAAALFEKRYSQNLTMRYGALFNQEMSGPHITPIVDINWQLNSRWSIVGMLPISLKANYKVSERFTAGFSHFGLITTYFLTAPEYFGDYMERTSIDLTLFGRLQVYGNWHLEGRFGYAVGRNYDQYAADQKIDLRISIVKIGDDRGAPKNVSFQNGPIASLHLIYSLPLPN